MPPIANAALFLVRFKVARINLTSKNFPLSLLHNFVCKIFFEYHVKYRGKSPPQHYETLFPFLCHLNNSPLRFALLTQSAADRYFPYFA